MHMCMYQITGKWGGKALEIAGHVTSQREDFHGSLSINTPFEAFPHALLVLGKGFDGVNHKVTKITYLEISCLHDIDRFFLLIVCMSRIFSKILTTA